MGPIVFFDGVCNLCNRSVDFIIQRDPKGIFRFSSLQSDTAKQFLDETLKLQGLTTIALLKNEKLYYKSNAVLEIVKQLNGLWPLLYIFKIVPRFIRDHVYDYVSNHRYRWFGRRDICRVPSAGEASRFVDGHINATMI